MRLPRIFRRGIGIIPIVIKSPKSFYIVTLAPGDRFDVKTGDSKIRLHHMGMRLDVLLASPDAVACNWEGMGNNDKEEVANETKTPTMP